MAKANKIETSVSDEVESTPIVEGALTVPKQVSGELLPRDPQTMVDLQTIANTVGLTGGTVIDNFPTDPMKRWKLDNASTTGVSRPLDEIVNEVIDVKYWRIEAVRIENIENGELIDCPRCVLVDQDGKFYHATSTGIFQVIASFIRTFGTGPLPKEFKLKVAKIRTRKSFGMLTLQAV